MLTQTQLAWSTVPFLGATWTLDAVTFLQRDEHSRSTTVLFFSLPDDSPEKLM